MQYIRSESMVKRFIVWYLKRHNVQFYYNGYIVRMFTEPYYYKVMQNHNAMEKRIINSIEQTKLTQ